MNHPPSLDCAQQAGNLAVFNSLAAFRKIIELAQD
jgi:hypothetical protein